LGTPSGTSRPLRPRRPSPGRRGPRSPVPATPEATAAAPAGGSIPQGTPPVALADRRGPPARESPARQPGAVERGRLPPQPDRLVPPGGSGRGGSDPQERTPCAPAP